MRFYYFSNSMFPSNAADSVNVMNTTAELSELVSDLHVSGISGGGSTDEIYKYYGISPSFKLHRLNRIVKKGSLYLSAILDVIRIKRLKPTVVYGRSIFTARMLHLARIPFYFECHDAKWLVNKRYERLYFEVFTSPYLLKLVVVSQKLKELTLAKYPRFNGYPVQVIRNGAAIPRITNRTSTGEFKVGYVGGFYSGRGLDVVVAIAPKLPEFTFYLAGGNTEDLKLLLLQSVIPPNVCCLGYLSPSETANFRSEMSVLLAPYQLKTTTMGGTDTTAYMSPIKIFEYMSSSTPIVSSDLPAIREVLTPEMSLLVPAASVAHWVQAIRKLHEDETYGKAISARAYDYFLTNLTWKARAEKIIQYTTKE
jgi:glycosyltransferase involved in cell wall biosynthesis